MRRQIVEYYGAIEQEEELTAGLWGEFDFSASWEALREMLALYSDRDLSGPNPFPVERQIESHGSLKDRWRSSET